MRSHVIVILALLPLQGCVQQPQSQVASPDLKVVAAKIRTTEVVILASEDSPAYSEVAKALAKELGQRATIYYLTENQSDNLKTIARLKTEDHIQVVSIGLNASMLVKSLTHKQVVFCQVFNYQDYALLTSRHKGVSMLPSLPKTFETWRTLAPATRNIGVITGPGFDDVIQTAQAAAKARGFKLHHQVVNSDKEYQYAYKKMNRLVQGYWLLPDNRVLSEHILRDLMTFSVRNSKQVAVFNEELLKLGGLLSIGSDYQDIAQQVYNRLEQAQGKESIPGPDIIYPEKINLRINSVMARNLNLKIPVKYRKFTNAL